MNLQRVFLVKGLETKTASKRPFSGVNPHMSAELRRLQEDLLALKTGSVAEIARASTGRHLLDVQVLVFIFVLIFGILSNHSIFNLNSVNVQEMRQPLVLRIEDLITPWTNENLQKKFV